MSEQREYFRKVKALAAEVNNISLSKGIEPGSEKQNQIINLVNMKWERFCRKNKKANTGAFKEYMQLCQ